jgi:hypothetical protein
MLVQLPIIMRILKSFSLSALLSVAAVVGFQNASIAACPLIFSPNPGSGTVTIEAYWQINLSYSSPANIAVFQDTVTTGNSTVPAGTYLGWCIDATDSINGEPESYSDIAMFSSCDPNLDAELLNLGLEYHFTYPTTTTSDTAAQWNQLNYILNHPLAGASYWDIQGAIWNIVGGPLPPNSYFEGIFGASGPMYNTNNVSQMVQNAQTYAAGWQPECGNVIAVILAITNADALGDFPVQLTILEVPVTVTPTLTPGTIGCYTSLAEADTAATNATTVTPSGTVLTVVNSGGDCPATITVTGTDSCGLSSSVTYTANILTAKPTFSGLPPATASYQSYSQVPAAPTVTATDSCGDKLTVNYTSSQTNPNSSCDDIITRTWMTMDCAGQTNAFTETITVNNTSIQTTCGNCGFQNCNGGYIWCNAHLTCNPGKACTVYCQNASVTLTCRNGKTYTYPVPDCQVNFSQNCRTASCSFQGGNWCTTVPCGGDSQIFLSGCGIPWQSAFANCCSMSCSGTFCCSTPGVNCQWQCGGSCYNCNLSNCGSIQVKPCYQNSCGFNNNNDCAGTPENCKAYCQGGNNYCGSWSNSGYFSCR